MVTWREKAVVNDRNCCGHEHRLWTLAPVDHRRSPRPPRESRVRPKGLQAASIYIDLLSFFVPAWVSLPSACRAKATGWLCKAKPGMSSPIMHKHTRPTLPG